MGGQWPNYISTGTTNTYSTNSYSYYPSSTDTVTTTSPHNTGTSNMVDRTSNGTGWDLSTTYSFVVNGITYNGQWMDITLAQETNVSCVEFH